MTELVIIFKKWTRVWVYLHQAETMVEAIYLQRTSGVTYTWKPDTSRPDQCLGHLLGLSLLTGEDRKKGVFSTSDEPFAHLWQK